MLNNIIENNAEQILILDTQINQALQKSFTDLPSPYEDAELHLMQATCALHQHLSLEMLLNIKRFSRDPAAPGFMLLENFPLGNLSATPVDGAIPADRKDFVAESVSLGLGSLLGDPIGYKWEKDSLLPHHVIPLPGGEYTQSNQSSKVFLRYHNDMVFDESLSYNSFNPDFLVLLCVKPDRQRQAETRYADARTILSKLSKLEVERLRQPSFRMASPSNYSRLLSSNGIKWSNPQPIITGSGYFPEIGLGANGVVALNKEDQVLLDKIYSICDDPKVYTGIKLKQGQAMLINNRKGVHARTEFKPTGDTDERWLIRANVRTDLWSMRHRIDGDFRRYA